MKCKSVHIIIVYFADGLTERFRLHFTSMAKARKYTESGGYGWTGGIGLMKSALVDSLAAHGW